MEISADICFWIKRINIPNHDNTNTCCVHRWGKRTLGSTSASRSSPFESFQGCKIFSVETNIFFSGVLPYILQSTILHGLMVRKHIWTNTSVTCMQKEKNCDLQGVPNNVIIECWHHLGLESVFWSFLTKTKQDQAPPSHVHGKIWPHSTQFWLWFCSIGALFWDTL